MRCRKVFIDRSKFRDQFSFSFLVQRGTFYVDKENFELLFITRNKKINECNIKLYMKNVFSIRNLKQT